MEASVRDAAEEAAGSARVLPRKTARVMIVNCILGLLVEECRERVSMLVEMKMSCRKGKGPAQ